MDDRLQRLFEASKRFDVQARAVRQLSSVIRPELLDQARLAQERLKLIPSFPTIMKLNSDLMGFQRNWRQLSSVMNPDLIELGRRATQLSRGIAPALENFRKASQIFGPLFEELYRHDAAARRGEAAGWLPHRTMNELTETELRYLMLWTKRYGDDKAWCAANGYGYAWEQRGDRWINTGDTMDSLVEMYIQGKLIANGLFERRLTLKNSELNGMEIEEEPQVSDHGRDLLRRLGLLDKGQD